MWGTTTKRLLRLSLLLLAFVKESLRCSPCMGCNEGLLITRRPTHPSDGRATTSVQEALSFYSGLSNLLVDTIVGCSQQSYQLVD